MFGGHNVKYFALILDVLYKKRRMIRNFSIISGLFLLFMTISISTTSTTAHFIKQQDITMQLNIGTWWDKSDLHITTDPVPNPSSCTNLTIDFYIHNTGFTMIDSTTYTLYYTTTGDPLQEGTIYNEGTIQPIETNDLFHLSFENVDEGYYLLRVNQHPLYNNNSTPHYADSSVLTVKCEEETIDEEMPSEEDTNTENTTEPTEPMKDDETTIEETIPEIEKEKEQDQPKQIEEEMTADKDGVEEEVENDETAEIPEPITEEPEVTNEPLIEEDTDVENEAEEEQADPSITE